LKSWKKVQAKEIKNMDLIKPAVDLLKRREVVGTQTYFNWVKGHAGNAGNEAADQLAVAGARYVAQVISTLLNSILNACEPVVNMNDVTANSKRRRSRNTACARPHSAGK
jgi:hypothetical protein